MKSNHLRVGNYIEKFGIPEQVDGQLIVSLTQIESAGKIAIDVSPILLTEKIVRKIRQVMRDDFKPIAFRPEEPRERRPTWHYQVEVHDDIFLEISPTYENINNQEKPTFWFAWVNNRNNGYFMPIVDIFGASRIQYLHQLQNLFFALSGRELFIDFTSFDYR